MMLLKFILKFFFRKTPTQLLLDFNHEELGSSMQRLSVEIYRCRTESAIKVLARVIDTARNIQIIDCNRVSPDGFQRHLGRLEALNDLATFFQQSLDPAVYEQRREKEAGNKPRILVKNNQKSEAVI